MKAGRFDYPANWNAVQDVPKMALRLAMQNEVENARRNIHRMGRVMGTRPAPEEVPCQKAGVYFYSLVFGEYGRDQKAGTSRRTGMLNVTRWSLKKRAFEFC